METKVCSKCKRKLDLSMFSKNKNTKKKGVVIRNA